MPVFRLPSLNTWLIFSLLVLPILNTLLGDHCGRLATAAFGGSAIFHLENIENKILLIFFNVALFNYTGTAYYSYILSFFKRLTIMSLHSNINSRRNQCWSTHRWDWISFSQLICMQININVFPLVEMLLDCLINAPEKHLIPG